MAFDPKCYELAEHFLPGASALNELAQYIQDSVEDWLRYEGDQIAAEHTPAPPPSPDAEWVASDCGLFERDPATGTVRAKGPLPIGNHTIMFGDKVWRAITVSDGSAWLA